MIYLVIDPYERERSVSVSPEPDGVALAETDFESLRDLGTPYASAHHKRENWQTY